MLAPASSLSVNPMFLRHDLLIELGRLELAIHGARAASANEPDSPLTQLEMRRATLSDTLRLLPA